MTQRNASKGQEYYEKFYTTSDWQNKILFNKIFITTIFKIVGIFRKETQIKKVLDIGCGTGIYTKLLSEKGYDALGVDFANTAIEKAKIKFPACRFMQQDARAFSLQEKFDLLFSKGLSIFNTYDFKDTSDTINSWKDLLSESGLIVIMSRTNFSKSSPSGWYFHNEDEILTMFRNSELNTSIYYLYSKFQYILLLPLPKKLLVKFVSSMSKNLIIKLLKVPVNYIVILEKK